MRHFMLGVTLAIVGASVGVIGASAEQGGDPAARKDATGGSGSRNIQLGPRPFFLVDDLEDGPLKDKLASCSEGPFKPTDFSIGHRGAALQFPEHTRESYEAAARMGAGIVECDVTFTADLELVCRHAQNDLHTTTNILTTPLAAKCTQPFVPATFDAAGNLLTPATRRMPDQRHHAGGVQDAEGQDGRLQPPGPHRGGVSGRHRELPHRPLRRPVERRAADPQREHRAVQAARRQDDPRAQVSVRVDAVQRVHPGGLRAEADRRVQGGGCLATRRLAAVVQQARRALLGEPRAGVRPTGRLSRRRRGGRGPARLRGPRAVQAGRHQHRRAAHLRAADRRRQQPDRAVRLRAQGEGGRARHHHLDARAIGHPRRRRTTASTTRRSTRRSGRRAT